MKRKKQGSTLIVVIIIFTFVTIVMTATLSMAASGYKARVIESKRVESLYSAESGLDIAYNIVGRTFNSAVAYANDQVTRLTEGSGDNSDPNTEKYSKLQEDIDYWKNRQIPDGATSDEIKAFKKENREKIMRDNEYIELLKNEEFKRSFNIFLYIQNNNIIDDEKNTDELAKTIVGKKYVKNIDAELENDRYEHVTFNKNDGQTDPELLVYDYQHPTRSVAANEDKSGIIYSSGDENIPKGAHDISLQNNYELNINVFDKQEYIVKVTSNFGGSNLRQVQATYTIKVPDYMQSIKRYQVLVDKPLIVGKNMNLNEVNNLTVNGTIFVQGEDEDLDKTGEIAYDKYLGGIKINRSSDVNFNDDVITRSTFNIIDQVGVDIKKNLYARNVYAGNGKEFSSGLDNNTKSKLNVENSLIVDNDLALKARYTDITINNFFGINDHNDNSSDDDKKRNSSTIIVNKDKNEAENPFTSSINIKNEAWIMGAAYINTEGKYETGESIGVKGNYEAYTSKVNSDEDKNLTFEYDSPLYLINGTVFDKGVHFVDYWSDPNRKNNMDTGGIILSGDISKIHSIGAIVYGNSQNIPQLPKGPRYNIEDQTEISQKQIEYASQVYKFGGAATMTDYTDGEDNAVGVSDLIDLSNIEDLGYKMKDQEKKTEKAIFNKDSRKIIIKKSTGEDSIDTPSDSSLPITIEAKDGILNAVVATNGDVTIEEDITFNGSIVTNGILEIEGNGVTINKNNEIVNRVQAQNPDLFQSVFKDGRYYNEVVDYDLSNYLDKKLWKLIK